jgi:uncharacterized protein YceK
MKKNWLLLIILISVLSGCSSGSSSDSSTATATTTTDFDGSYDTTVTSTTLFDINGGTCVDAAGLLTISNGELSGNVIDDRGATYTISGNVQSNGDVLGGFAIAGSNAASFEGVISGNTGSGTWEDIYQCAGNWQATENAVVGVGVLGSLTITGDSQVPGTFTPDSGTGSTPSVSNGLLITSWSATVLPSSWVLFLTIYDDYFGTSGARLTFGEYGSIDYSCESGIVGLYGDCSGATFDHNTRTVTFSNVQLQAPGFGTVITLNGTLVY